MPTTMPSLSTGTFSWSLFFLPARSAGEELGTRGSGTIHGRKQIVRFDIAK